MSMENVLNVIHELFGSLKKTPITAIAILCPAFMTPVPAELPAMTAYFPLDDTGSEVTESLSGAKEKLASGSEWISGKIGGGMSVKAGTHFPHNAAYDFAKESFTITFWTRADNGKAGRHPHPLSKGDYSASEKAGGIRWEFHAEMGNVYFTLDDGQNKSEAFTPKENCFTGEWVHVAGIRDTGQKKLYLYVNGELKGTADDGSGSVANSVDLVIGDASRDDNHFQGDLDDIRFYRHALAEGQIKEIVAINSSVHTAMVRWRTHQKTGKFPFYNGQIVTFLSPIHGDFNSIEITDLLGNTVRILPFSSHAYWDGKDMAGRGVEAGMYIAAIKGADHIEYRRLFLSR